MNRLTEFSSVNPLRRIWQSLAITSSPRGSASRFVDLAPTGDADQTGIYFRALEYATSNPEVLNIALTGPYGSGKSSVIKSFLSRYTGTALQLSLASFLHDGEVPGMRVSKQEIERSILQQILYGADANRLPLSRFKRIQTPKKWSPLNSLFVSIAVFCLWYLFSKQADLLSGNYFKPFQASNWFNFFCFAIGSIFVWRMIHSVYIKSFGFSLKSISLKDIQIAPHAADEESILNRHLDEILYFFQSTKYDLVVIEDLDRFENPDIFVTLREINGLINANAGIHRRVRFLYALRDDIFVNTDRTKFFEFIVPVIPIINHSNSIDKVLEHGQRVSLDARIDRRFIRDVSRYLSDLRLIANIFNEYVIYSSNLKADQDNVLDPNKLLAVLIYKNVIPKDFAALHRQEGALSKVLSRYEEYISKIETGIRSELTSTQAEREEVEKHSLRDQKELCQVYAMAIIERAQPYTTAVSVANSNVPFTQLARYPDLQRILARDTITALHVNGQRLAIDIKGVEADVDPTKTFAERKIEVERKSIKYLAGLEKRTQELKTQLASLRTRKFNEVVRESASVIEEVFAEVGENSDLLKFLILEGYLDDTYYQYISLFHSGRLSPNDNKFLIQIRSYNNPSPDFQIDNAQEVVASMREEDFGHHYVLNRFVIDQLLADSQKYTLQIAAAIQFIANHFEKCADFFSSYYERGVQVDRLVSTLAVRWQAFAGVALDGPQSAAHAARILAYAPAQIFEDASYPGREALIDYVSVNTLQLLNQRVEFDPRRLVDLGAQVENLADIGGHEDLVSLAASEGLYRISIANLRYIMEHVVRWRSLADLETRHYSTLLEANSIAVLAHIDRGFDVYLREVLLKLDHNTAEDLPCIVNVIARQEVDQDLRRAFLEMQAAVFPSFESVPPGFHGTLLTNGKIEPTWANCVSFMVSEAYSSDLLTAYLQRDDTRTALTLQPMPGDDSARVLCHFLVGNETFSRDVYRVYVRMLPKRFPGFPDVSPSKMKVLIEEDKIEFSAENVEHLESEDLKVLFVALNFGAYLADPNKYAIDDPFRHKLLISAITDAQKLHVIADIDPGFVARNAPVASVIGPILDRSSIRPDDFGPQVVQAVIMNARPEALQISLLNKLHGALSVAEVRDLLRVLPEPYCDIASFGKFPRIDDSEANQQLASWLKERSLISSFAPALFGGIRINTFRKPT
ncbi:YobI family P-loop NTPase [Rhizobium sp. SL42]|uniref:YobI family P-loop NTPase n=1 Tax=Rhizobium sp. SL42 TaxID=2806346 RepID=UPI001F3F3BDD|nr:ATP-binding protein [Rhizobium sp. SL42]UJW73530.1 ATP-binding protein [Rhizobium sp. SL42]